MLRLVRSFVLAAACTAVLIAAAVGAMYVTHAPKVLSLAVEPFSLLLVPGLLVALAVAGRHDFSAMVVVETAAAFYLLLLWVWFWWRERATGPGRGGSR